MKLKPQQMDGAKRSCKDNITVTNSMADYFDGGKFERKVDPDYVPPIAPVHKREDGIRENTIVLLDSNFDLDTREGNYGFCDMII